MKLAHLFISILIIVIIISCGPNYALNKTYDIDNNQWTYADSLRFEFEIKDTTAIYNLTLDVKHTTNYSFQNLYTNIHTQFPNGTRLSKPVSLELADKTGVWQGDCNSKTCTLEIPIQEGAYFNQPGKYVITVEQFMRDSIINGVKSITMKVAETGKRR